MSKPIKMLAFLQMYDPLAGKSWVEAFVIEGRTLAELNAELANLKAQHAKWTGGAEGEGSC